MLIDNAGMIRRVRYAVLAFVVLGVLGIGVAVDWSSPSRAPVPAIKLQAAPSQEQAGAGPRATVKAKYGGRNLNRVALPKIKRPARVENEKPSPASSTGPRDSGLSGSEAPPAATDRSTDEAEDGTTDRPRPRSTPPQAPPAPPQTSGTGADPAPVPLPAPAGEQTDDDDEDDDDDDDGGGGGGDDDGDDDDGDDG
jgi:hypothetical protein